MSGTYITITPFGRVDVVFEDDGTGASMSGPEDACAHIRRVVSKVTDHRGMTVAMETMEPATYMNFCCPAGGNMQIIAPAELALELINGTESEPLG